MDKQTLRPLVFEILKKTPQTHFHAIENDLRKLSDLYERHDVLTLQEVLWELLVQGVLAPGKNSLNLNLPFVHVTDYGAQCLEDGVILAHDPDRYIEQLRDRSGAKLDERVVHSCREALANFLVGSWASSLILLARAAEILFDQLDQSLSAMRSAGETSPRSSVPRFSLSQAKHVIETALDADLSADTRASIEPQLNGLLALIQSSREQDGAPRWPRPSRDQVQGLFLLFPEQCAFVYHLMKAISGDAEA